VPDLIRGDVVKEETRNIQQTVIRLQGYLGKYGHKRHGKYPKCWEQFDMFRQQRGKVDLPGWPEWCYCPVAGAIAIVTRGMPEESFPGKRPLQLNMQDVGPLAALAAWRVTQGIYRFDPSLYEELVATPIDGTLPTEHLFHLPEWCVYIETPNNPEHLGVFVHLEHCVESGRNELRFVFDTEDLLFPVALHIDHDNFKESLEAFFRSVAKEMRGTIDEDVLSQYPWVLRSARDRLARILPPLLSLVLYLCTIDADVTGAGGRSAGNREGRPVNRRQPSAPQTPVVWNTGFRIGAALRRAAAETRGPEETGERGASHASPRPHIRRAHWHSFWTGPRKESEERKRVLKWLPPIPVNVELENIVPIVRPVKE
jgi:hypothetical protein